MNKIKTVFLQLEFIIYFTFLLLDINACNSRISSIIKYTGILFCFLCAILQKNETIIRGKYILSGLLFTIVADFFLVLLNNKYLLGVFFFCVVQICYYIFLEGLHLKPYLQRIPIIMIFFLVYYYIVGNDIISYISIFYIINSIFNIRIAFYKKVDFKFLFGLILLFLCDLCVGISNIASIIENFNCPVLFIPVISYFIWVFYLPSQVLISLSIQKENL